MAYPLYVLYRAARVRRPQLPPAVGVLTLLAPILTCVYQVAFQFLLIDRATHFATRTDTTYEAAKRLIDHGVLPIIRILGVPAQLAMGFAFVFVCLNAMRAGLLTRFMGYIGIITGVLFVIPLGPLAGHPGLLADRARVPPVRPLAQPAARVAHRAGRALAHPAADARGAPGARGRPGGRRARARGRGGRGGGGRRPGPHHAPAPPRSASARSAAESQVTGPSALAGMLSDRLRRLGDPRLRADSSGKLVGRRKVDRVPPRRA